MLIYSANGQYQQTRRTHRRRRQKRKMPVVMIFLICLLVGAVVWAAWPDGESAPDAVLELPDNINLLSPVLADLAEVTAEDFVSGLEGTGISVAFAQEPSREPGKQTVTLRFLKGDSSCTHQTSCYWFHLQDSVTVDMSEGHTADIRDFASDDTLEIIPTDSEPPRLDECGEKQWRLQCGGRRYEVVYIVREGIPPVGIPQTVTAQIGTVPEPETLLARIEDHSTVTVSYLETPVLTMVGSYPVTLLLTDAYGNSSTVTSTIDVIPAADAPQFEGVVDLYVKVGNTVSYKSGVTAVDSKDGAVNFTVDAGQVNLNAEGTYTVYYSATDSDGNTTIIPRQIIVESVDRAAVEGYAREVLNKIITDGMTLDQKIQAVYSYTRHKVWYVGTSDKTSIMHAAYEGFSTKQGDCYTYYAMNAVMFDLLGIEHLEVTRIGGTSHHWWNLVKFEDGKYYHVDSTPTAVTRDDVFHGKMTESDLVVYTNDPGVINRRPNFYVYDKTLPVYEGIEIAP